VALADDIVAGRFDPDALAALDDDDVRAALTARLGIGRWTADIYLLMALARPDVWPTGDLALGGAMRRAKSLPGSRPTTSSSWSPSRGARGGAIGARILWHAYLSGER
jgi:DNA-3-methyladenine glycosylase II